VPLLLGSSGGFSIIILYPDEHSGGGQVLRLPESDYGVVTGLSKSEPCRPKGPRRRRGPAAFPQIVPGRTMSPEDHRHALLLGSGGLGLTAGAMTVHGSQSEHCTF
jgi:hypothetical protein